MKKVLLVLIIVATSFFIGCSSDSGSIEPAPRNLDASLLPGYWIMVKDGVKQNYGYFFSNESLSDTSEGVKTAIYFRLPNGMDAPAECAEKASWFVTEDGIIVISIYGYVMPIMRLTKDRMTIRTFASHLDDGYEVRRDYERLSGSIEIKN